MLVLVEAAFETLRGAKKKNAIHPFNGTNIVRTPLYVKVIINQGAK